MSDFLYCLGIGICVTIFFNADTVAKLIMACF